MTHSRTAEYSIKGYLYQFLIYLDELLSADAGHKVVIEGAVEDIDVIGPTWQKAVQCKYHESVENFTLGKLYKPLLLMMEHFSENQTPAVPIDYHLYCYFPGQSGTKSLTSADLDMVKATTDRALKKIAARIKPFSNADFLARLTIIFGVTFKEMEEAVQKRLIAVGFHADDVKAIFYPAAFQKVAETSINTDITDRTLEKTAFVDGLKTIKSVTLTRWTRELATQKEIFKRLREDITGLMAANSARRHFHINPSGIEDFEANFPPFVKRFVEKYAFKYLHMHAPVFIIEAEPDTVNRLAEKLYSMKMRAHNGRVGANFKPDLFFKRPMIAKKRGAPIEREFDLALCSIEELPDQIPVAPDTTFIVRSGPAELMSDSTFCWMDISKMSQLEYLFKLRTHYE